MPRPLKADRPVERKVYLPTSINDAVQVLLFSPAEGKVPHGAFSSFVERLIRDALARLPSTQGNPHGPIPPTNG